MHLWLPQRAQPPQKPRPGEQLRSDKEISVSQSQPCIVTSTQTILNHCQISDCISCVHTTVDAIRLFFLPFILLKKMFNILFCHQCRNPKRRTARTSEESLQMEHKGRGQASLQRASEGEGESVCQVALK